jgi:hypothetical protein
MAVSRFLICVDNRGYPASLELRKVYRRVPDASAGKKHFVRIVDESGEDYLYPDRLFVPIELPRAARTAFQQAS